MLIFKNSQFQNVASTPPPFFFPHLTTWYQYKFCKGTLRLGMEILRENGISSLFQGFQPTLARQIVGSFAWFYSYEYMKQRTRDDSASLFLCGGFASWVYWTVVYPIDSIKTRIQADAICGKQSRQYKGWIHCFLSTLRLGSCNIDFNTHFCLVGVCVSIYIFILSTTRFLQLIIVL